MIFLTQILRENNFSEFRSAKSAILAHLEALNFHVLWIFALFENEIDQNNYIQSS